MYPSIRHFGLTVGAFFVVAAVALWVITRDEAPPSIADLATPPQVVPAEENAYFMLRKLADEFGAQTVDDAYIATLARLEEDVTWTMDDALRVIRSEDFDWERFDALSGLSQSEAAVSFHRERTPQGLSKLWMAALARVKFTARTTGPDEALALALNTQAKALIVTDAGGTMIDTIIGIGLYAIAQDSVDKFLLSERPSSESLR